MRKSFLAGTCVLALFVAALPAAAKAASVPTPGTATPPRYDQCGFPDASAAPVNENKGLLANLRVTDDTDSGTASKGAGSNVLVSTPPPEAPAAPVQMLPDYVRLMIKYVPCPAASDRVYGLESRGWLKRMFLHKKVGKILKVVAVVRPLGVNATKTLSEIDFDSGSKGENWTTNVDNNAVLLPYFRADNRALVGLDITFSSTRSYESGIASTTLDLAKRAATLISPTSSLITKDNKDRFNDAANFVDTAINGLLKIDVNESVHIDAPPTAGKPLATIALFVPPADDPYLSHPERNHAAGEWQITSETLNGSIFPTASGDDKRLSPAQIMNFRVSDDKTLKSALTASNNVQTARDALLKSKKGADVSDAALTLCRAIAAEADAQGFSNADVGRVVWAYLSDLALPTQSRSDAFTACAQVDHWPSSAEIGPAQADAAKTKPAAKAKTKARKSASARSGSKKRKVH
ncbi:MAG TPA: hypothetical protein VFW35_00825 [Sphingomicrobium sp.]|nr:hypothetical protein [Sphingomicrobium sp.]